jgi:hypothetical protein
MKPTKAEEYLTWNSEAAGDVHPGLQVITLDKAREFSRLQKIEELERLKEDFEHFIIDIPSADEQTVKDCISILESRIEDIQNK